MGRPDSREPGFVQQRRTAFHPLLFATAPALSLFVDAYDQLEFRELLWPVLCCEAMVAILWAGAGWLLRDWSRGAALASGSLILLFGFGHVAPAFAGFDRLALVVWTFACVVLWAAVTLSRPPPGLMDRALDFAALAFLALPLFSLTLTSLSTLEPAASRKLAVRPLPRDAERPDIYYVVLDGFGSASTLRRVYDLDIRAFVESLRELGFFVAERSHSNYSQTQLSLASSLNLSYLEDLGVRISAEDTRRGALRALIQQSRLVDALERLDYSLISFESGYSATELRHSSRYLRSGRALSEFEGQLLDWTPLPQLFPGFAWLNRYEQHRNRIGYTLETLPELAATRGPKFVFAHILSPHPPFVFAADGSAVGTDRRFSIRDGSHLELPRAAYLRGYRDQVRYLSNRMLESVSALLESSSTPPIVVIQGDHGPGAGLDHERLDATDVHERLSIFNALYLGGAPQDELYAEISPVNTFRYILTHQLGQLHPLLPDRSYFSTWLHPYAFQEVTETLAAGAGPGPRELAIAVQQRDPVPGGQRP